jgi:hypothetical protein
LALIPTVVGAVKACDDVARTDKAMRNDNIFCSIAEASLVLFCFGI